MEGACRFLMDAGLCFYSSSLKLVVTDPQWLANLFKDVISFFSGVKDGVVTRELLAHTWKGSTAEEISQNMLLFEKFQMAFPRVQAGVWVVPSMLKEQAFGEPRGIERARRRFERTYELEVAPPGLVGRLMARLQELSSVTLRDMWRSGVQFASRDGLELGQAVLELGQRCALRVQCWTLTPERRAQYLIQTVTAECSALLDDMFAMRQVKPYTEFVSCPHCLAAAGKLGRPVTRLPMELCANKVVMREQLYACGNEAVSVSLLCVDVTFGNLEVLEDTALHIEEVPFAAGAYGIISRARLNDETVVVKVGEALEGCYAGYVSDRTIFAPLTLWLTRSALF